MSWLLFIVNAENQRIALVGEEDFDGVVGIATVGKKLELAESWFFEQLEFGDGFWKRHIGVAFFYEELLQHFIGRTQTRTGEGGPVFPSIAAAAQIIAASLRELLAHGHVRL